MESMWAMMNQPPTPWRPYSRNTLAQGKLKSGFGASILCSKTIKPLLPLNVKPVVLLYFKMTVNFKLLSHSSKERIELLFYVY